MAASCTMSRKAKYLIQKAQLNLDDQTAGTFKAVPVTAAFCTAFNPDTHAYANQITNEVTTNGMARKALTNVALSEVAGNTTKWTSDKITQTASGADATFRGHVIIKDTGTPATSPIICLADAGVDINVPSGSSHDITPDATNGWLG